MGNTLITTQKIACGHTDNVHLRQTLLCDRLSKPTADMVEALIALQKLTPRMQQFADRATGAAGTTSVATAGDGSSRALMMLATAYCILFGLECTTTPYSRSTMGRQPNDLIAAFDSALRRPQQFLQDMIMLRAQEVPREKVMMLVPLTRDGEISPQRFRSSHGDVLRQLAAFLQGAVECAQIYSEIRDSAEAGSMDWSQAEKLLEGAESDQRRMIEAMGGNGDAYDETLYEDVVDFECHALNGYEMEAME